MSDPGSFFRKVLPWAMLSLLLVLQGCITIEENYTFKKDGSGAMEYVVDMSELADLMNGLPGAKDKGDGMGKLDLIENIAKLKAITGISKVKVKKEKDGFIQRLSFRFTDVAALNGALNEIISDSTGTGPKEFFRWDGSTLVARTKGRTKGMGNSMGGGSEDSTGAEGMLKMMKYKFDVRFAEEIADVQAAEGMVKEPDGPKRMKLSTDWSVLDQDSTALDMRFTLKK